MAREDADSAVDQLYALPLGEFTRARNALAARLREAGQRAAATEIAGLAKPSPVVWAVNQLARGDRVGVERLVQAVERLRAAQLQQAGGQLAPAQAAERTALDQLLARARTLLQEAGLAGTPEMLERVAATLLGGASDAATRGDLRRGRLARELPRPGFEVFAGARPAAPARTPSAGPNRGKAAQAEARRLRAARETLRAAETEARERARQADELERAAADQRRAAEEAARAAEAARRQAATAEQQVAEAEQAVRGAEERRPR